MKKLVIEETPSDPEERVCVQVFDKDNKLVQRTYGPNKKELQLLHDRHACGYLCPICYNEACAELQENDSKGEEIP